MKKLIVLFLIFTHLFIHSAERNLSKMGKVAQAVLRQRSMRAYAARQPLARNWVAKRVGAYSKPLLNNFSVHNGYQQFSTLPVNDGICSGCSVRLDLKKLTDEEVIKRFFELYNKIKFLFLESGDIYEICIASRNAEKLRVFDQDFRVWYYSVRLFYDVSISDCSCTPPFDAPECKINNYILNGIVAVRINFSNIRNKINFSSNDPNYINYLCKKAVFEEIKKYKSLFEAFINCMNEISSNRGFLFDDYKHEFEKLDGLIFLDLKTCQMMQQ